MGGQRWKVVGGGEKGGILVREGKNLDSTQLDDRLATGALVEEWALEDERLHFRKLAGAGPDSGWVSTHFKGRELIVRAEGAEAEEAEEEPEEGGPSLGSFTGEGRTLGSSSPAAGQAAETPEERRLRALEAAQRRQASIPGVSEKKRAELLEAQAKEELPRKLTEHYARSGGELPLGLRAASAEQLRRHWQGLGEAGAGGGAEDPPPEQARRPGSSKAFTAMLAKQAQGEQEQRREADGRSKEDIARKNEEDRARKAEEEEQRREAERRAKEARARKAEEERARRSAEEEDRARKAEEEWRERELQKTRETMQRALEAERKAEALRKTPRSRLVCASPGCCLLVHSRPEMGGYCCIACSEGGPHGPRCEQRAAPVDAVKADPNWETMGGDQMEDMELEQALMNSILEAVPRTAFAHAVPAEPAAKGKSQEELDLEEAMRLSMLDAEPVGQEVVDDEALELEEAIRLSQTMDGPPEPAKQVGEAEATQLQGEGGSDEDEDDDDDEVPDLVPIEQQ